MIANNKTTDFDAATMGRRLESIRQALGAKRLGVARRLSSSGSSDRVYEVLAVSGDVVRRSSPSPWIWTR